MNGIVTIAVTPVSSTRIGIEESPGCAIRAIVLYFLWMFAIAGIWIHYDHRTDSDNTTSQAVAKQPALSDATDHLT
jgi:hypothetical protein